MKTNFNRAWQTMDEVATINTRMSQAAFNPSANIEFAKTAAQEGLQLLQTIQTISDWHKKDPKRKISLFQAAIKNGMAVNVYPFISRDNNLANRPQKYLKTLLETLKQTHADAKPIDQLPKDIRDAEQQSQAALELMVTAIEIALKPTPPGARHEPWKN